MLKPRKATVQDIWSGFLVYNAEGRAILLSYHKLLSGKHLLGNIIFSLGEWYLHSGRINLLVACIDRPDHGCESLRLVLRHMY